MSLVTIKTKPSIWSEILSSICQNKGFLFKILFVITSFLCFSLNVYVISIAGIKHDGIGLAIITNILYFTALGLCYAFVAFAALYEVRDEHKPARIAIAIVSILLCMFIVLTSSSSKPFVKEGQIWVPKVHKEAQNMHSKWSLNGVRYYTKYFSEKKVFANDLFKAIVFSVSLDYEFTKSGIPVEKMDMLSSEIKEYLDSKKTLAFKDALVVYMKSIEAGYSGQEWLEKFSVEEYNKSFQDFLNKKLKDTGVSVTKLESTISLGEDE